jgi:hypothetical protein
LLKNRDGLSQEATRHSAVIDTRTGQYALLNYYGYALFAFHTLSAWSGQTVDLHARQLAFRPHLTAFGGSGGGSTAVLPILLGGDLGTVTITPTTATIIMPFLAQLLSFENITICQHVFLASPSSISSPSSSSSSSPHRIARGVPLILHLPTPCETSLPSAESTTVTSDYSSLPGPLAPGDQFEWPQQPLPEVSE